LKIFKARKKQAKSHLGRMLCLAVTTLVTSACAELQTPPAIPPAVLSDDCLEFARAQEALAELALQAMQNYGRIDPGLYARDEKGGFVVIGEGAVKDATLRQKFDATLARVNATGPFLAAFSRGYAAAQEECSKEACPAVGYTFDVQRIPTERKKDQLYHWTVKGAPPPAAAWRGFARLYEARPELCPVPSSLVIESRVSGIAQTSGLFDHLPGDAALGDPCSCYYAGSKNLPTSPCSSCPYRYGHSGSHCAPVR